jgi:hypothetical protein
MTCPLKTEETDLLLDYSAGRLTARLGATKAAILARHVAICPDCAAFRNERTAVWHALDLWEPAPVSMDFNRRLWQRIEAVEAAPWYRRLGGSLRFANWKPVLPLTAAILVIAGGFLLDHPGRQNAVPGVSVTEADQVEQTLDDIQLLQQLDAVAPVNGGNSKSM